MNNRLRGVRFQSDRFFHVLGDGWYFEAREGMFGPYDVKAKAQLALRRLIERFPQKRPESLGGRAA